MAGGAHSRSRDHEGKSCLSWIHACANIVSLSVLQVTSSSDDISRFQPICRERLRIPLHVAMNLIFSCDVTGDTGDTKDKKIPLARTEFDDQAWTGMDIYRLERGGRKEKKGSGSDLISSACFHVVMKYLKISLFSFSFIFDSGQLEIKKRFFFGIKFIICFCLFCLYQPLLCYCASLERNYITASQYASVDTLATFKFEVNCFVQLAVVFRITERLQRRHF